MNLGSRTASLAAGLVVTTLALLLTASAASASDWSWTITPYAWATDVGVNAKVADREIVDEEIAVGDLLEDLDTIVQLRLDVQHGQYGLALDLFDVTLSDQVSGVALPENAGEAALDSDMGMTILDVAGLFDPKGDKQGVSFLYGVRVLNERATVDATFLLDSGSSTGRYETEDTFVDGLVGIRLTKRFSRHWSYQMQADLSTGGTDYTWSAGPSIAYAFGQSGRYSLTAGYRRMEVNFEEDGELNTEMTLSGVLVGLRLSY